MCVCVCESECVCVRERECVCVHAQFNIKASWKPAVIDELQGDATENAVQWLRHWTEDWEVAN